ncbi:hypothetical protein [Pseudomonas synxantha]|uniref:Uncharacterized protein n=1 Tax=Pseudomonas synxantha TaxID=47883 RepID=A0ACC6JVI5_9PSED|nr:hypothetical protein [Pseudomonas synxantha]MDR6610355.1 hypothetical protein [Pseudomonas synxantha]
MLAKAVCQATLILNVPASSRASPLPQKSMYGLAAALSAKRPATLINADTYFGRFDLLLACLTL